MIIVLFGALSTGTKLGELNFPFNLNTIHNQLFHLVFPFREVFEINLFLFSPPRSMNSKVLKCGSKVENLTANSLCVGV